MVAELQGRRVACRPKDWQPEAVALQNICVIRAIRGSKCFKNSTNETAI
jgi:hypothetical protein